MFFEHGPLRTKFYDLRKFDSVDSEHERGWVGLGIRRYLLCVSVEGAILLRGWNFGRFKERMMTYFLTDILFISWALVGEILLTFYLALYSVEESYIAAAGNQWKSIK